jgi:serine/threonine-protein kinase
MSVGDVLAGRYELEKLIGAGGMSSVYLARDSVLGRRVAIKILHPQFNAEGDHVERFRREAELVAALSHPNIVKVLDRGRHAGGQFIVFEYVDGETLKQLVARTGALPVDEALRIAIQVAAGLGYAHASGVVHRDVKAQNVMLGAAGEAKVTDFGIARSLDAREGMTLTGTVLGSAEYIAPEQAQGQKVSEASDIYSLGVVLYELLTGEPPFSGESFVAVAMRHINEPAPSVLLRRPDCPARVATAVERALAKSPAARFATMDAFRAELEACLATPKGPASESATVITPPPPRPPRQPRARRRRRVSAPLIAIVLGLVVLLAVGGYLLFAGSSTPSRAGTDVDHSRLVGVSAYDPQGDGVEHNAQAPLATDGDQATYWETESYLNAPSLAGKDGVGLVLQVEPPAEVKSVVVDTDTPGFQATIEAGNSVEGPFTPVSGSETVTASTTFDLTGGKEAYLVIWITRLGPGFQNAHVNEVRIG